MKTNVNWIKSWHYYRRYLKLVGYYKLTNTLNVYTEKHHILPKSMGGNNNKTNLVKLTPRAHYLAHYMLWKAYGNKEMAFAWHCMNSISRTKIDDSSKYIRYINSKVYIKSIIETRKILRESKLGINNPMYGKSPTNKGKPGPPSPRKGIKMNEDFYKRCSLSHMGNIPWNKGKTNPYSKEYRQKISHTTKENFKNPKNHPRYDHTIYSFYNEKLNLTINCTRFDLEKKYNLSNAGLSRLILCQRKHYHDWTILKQKIST